MNTYEAVKNRLIFLCGKIGKHLQSRPGYWGGFADILNDFLNNNLKQIIAF